MTVQGCVCIRWRVHYCTSYFVLATKVSALFCDQCRLLLIAAKYDTGNRGIPVDEGANDLTSTMLRSLIFYLPTNRTESVELGQASSNTATISHPLSNLASVKLATPVYVKMG
ncbi:hypothetical protein GQ600_10101 [Phytophthora cactorum]|nr:hypothetical protein GQ600_10101 [Phytophthora cactorum]